MADYYPLIARAIAGLDPSAPGESRRALYERARSALIAQLRSVEPPLTESEITRERLSLEEAVRKVEAEAAHRAREASRSDVKPRGGDAFRSSLGRTNPRSTGEAPTVAPQGSSAAPSRDRQTGAPAPAKPTPRSERPSAQPPSEPRPPRNLRVDPPPIPRQSQPSITMQDPTLPPTRDRGGDRNDETRPSQPKSPIRGFSDVTADVDDLGQAAAQANRAARKTFANVPSPTPEFDRLEPSMEDRSGDAGYNQMPAPPPPRGRGKGAIARKIKEKGPLRGGSRFPFKIAIIVGIAMVLIGTAILFGPKLWQSMRGGSTSQAVSTSKDVAQAPRPKITDRVGQPSLSDQIAPVAQRVVLYDEDPSDPQGKQYDGKVVWRIEQVKAAAGQPSDIAVRADVDIPERKLKMTMSFRRNTDSSLPASHTAELTFVLPPESGGGVANVPGILMKAKEDTRGVPLAGIAVKVTDGFFLVGLNNVEADRVRNIQLLKERAWFDIPLVYSNQRRAIITIEKGSPGERAFNEAFAAWGE